MEDVRFWLDQVAMLITGDGYEEKPAPRDIRLARAVGQALALMNPEERFEML